jgi:hypothetical protein
MGLTFSHPIKSFNIESIVTVAGAAVCTLAGRAASSCIIRCELARSYKPAPSAGRKRDSCAYE